MLNKSYDAKILLLEILLNLKEEVGVTSLLCENKGIGSYKGHFVSFVKNTAREAFNCYAIEWPEWSGSGFFPVPSYCSLSPYIAFDTKHKWSVFTKYGRARRRLLNFVIKSIEDTLNTESKNSTQTGS